MVRLYVTPESDHCQMRGHVVVRSKVRLGSDCGQTRDEPGVRLEAGGSPRSARGQTGASVSRKVSRQVSRGLK